MSQAVNGDPVIPGRWSRRKRDLGVVIWISFLAASVGTLIIFALVDPRELTNAWALRWEFGRKLGYTLGFMFLWAVCFLSAGLAVFMLRTGPRRGHARGRDGQPVPPQSDPDQSGSGLPSDDWP